MIDALDLASAIVNEYKGHDYLTNSKLSKALYFIYANYLQRGIKLFDNEFVAWESGPVHKSVYKAYSFAKEEPIPFAVNTYVTDEATSIAKESFTKFGYHTQKELMALSMDIDGAWEKVYDPEDLNKEITDEIILTTQDGIYNPKKHWGYIDAVNATVDETKKVLYLLSPDEEE